MSTDEPSDEAAPRPAPPEPASPAQEPAQEPSQASPRETAEATAEESPDAPPPAPGLLARGREALANPANRFVVAFLVYLAALAVLYPRFRIRYPEVMEWAAELTATAQFHFFSAFHDNVSQSGKSVHFDGFAVQIIEECTGLYEILIYTAAVMAFPTSLVKKAIGVGMGVPILYAINVARIAFLMWIGRYHYDLFDFMHLYFWQATLILMITSVWLLWIFQVVRREPRPRA